MKGLRLPGHAMPKDPLPRTAGTIVCGCGAVSPTLPSMAARRRWHRDHKDLVAGDAAPVEVLRGLILSRLTSALDGHDGGCEPGLCGHAAAVAARAVVDLHVPAATAGLGVVCAGCRIGGTSVRPDRCRTLATVAAALGLVDTRAAGAAVLCAHCGQVVREPEFIGTIALCAGQYRCHYAVTVDGHPATALRPGRGPCPDCAAQATSAECTNPPPGEFRCRDAECAFCEPFGEPSEEVR